MKRLLWILTAAWLLTACGDGEELISPDTQKTTPPKLPELTEPEALPHVDDVMEVIDDPYFARYALVRFDSNGDGRLSMAEVERAERIIYDEDSPELQADYGRFISMKGIEYFKNLEALEVRSSVLIELDLSHNSNLRELRFKINQGECRLKKLNVSHTDLEELEIPSSELEELQVSGSRLEKLSVLSTNGALKSLDVRYCEDLEVLELRHAALSSIDLRYCPRLEHLTINKTAISTIDLTQNSELSTVVLQENALSTINLARNTKVETLSLRGNKIKTIDISKLRDLTYLDVSQNPISKIDISHAEELALLYFDETNISEINTDLNPKLAILSCGNAKLKTLDLTTNPNISNLHCPNNEITQISFGSTDRLKLLCCENNRFTSLDFSSLNLTHWIEWTDETFLPTFAPQPNLEVLTLAACTQQVSLKQFTDCPKLRKVILHANEVPELSYEGKITRSKATLYVPSEAIASYEASPWAEAFAEVRSL